MTRTELEPSFKDGKDYLLLLKHLNEHEGKMILDGMFIWLFSDSETIGRKP
jgi:hypothetical protein